MNTSSIKTAWQQQDQEEKVLLVVSGQRFVTTRQTLAKYPLTKLGRLLQSNQSEHFFDADEDVFREVLRFQRTGELHIPKNICRETFLMELKFWEVEEENLADCCQIQEDLNNQVLEKQFSWFEKTLDPEGKITWKENIWYALTDPTGPHTKYKKAAKLWALIYGLLVTVEMIIIALTSTASQLESIQGEGNATAHRMLIKTFTEPCVIAVMGLQLLPSSAIFKTQYTFSAIFFIEVCVRLLTCPKKRKFFTSLGLMDFFTALSAFSFCSLTYTLGRTETYPKRRGVCLTFNIATLAYYMIIQLKSIRLLSFASRLGEVQVLLLALYNSRKEVYLLVLMLGLSSLLCGTVMYYAELVGSLATGNDDFHIDNIPIAYWWVIVTMTTVGYGDYYPTNVLGYITAAVIMMLGLTITALPIAIIGANFSTLSDYNKVRQRKRAGRLQEVKANEKESID